MHLLFSRWGFRQQYIGYNSMSTTEMKKATPVLTPSAVFTGMHVDGNSDLIQVRRVMPHFSRI